MTLNSEILGLPIPDAGPVFATALVIHILSGLTAVIAGALAATARKRPGRHPRAGRGYLWALGGIFTTATIMAAIAFGATSGAFGNVAAMRRIDSAIRNASPTDHAWNGQPPGSCGASPFAISPRWPSDVGA